MSSEAFLTRNIASENPPLRILIVEDDPLMQLGLEQCLQDYPQLEIVGQETDGYLGVETALKLKPDLVIMDIGLPHLDGIEATRQIKAALLDLRVVMLTSHTAENEMLAALASGADAYCIKGSRVSGLIAALVAVQEGAIYLDPKIARKAVEYLKPAATARNASNIAQLSQREMEVLKLIVEGRSNPEIPEILYLSPSTVKTHLKNIMNKLAVNDRVQAAVIALRSGLVQ